jgi:hypothetical protein
MFLVHVSKIVMIVHYLQLVHYFISFWIYLLMRQSFTKTTLLQCEKNYKIYYQLIVDSPMSSLSKHFMISFYPQLYDHYSVIKSIEGDQYVKVMRSNNLVKTTTELHSITKKNIVTFDENSKVTKQNKEDNTKVDNSKKYLNPKHDYWDIGFSGLF